jgi:hypothetical protein
MGRTPINNRLDTSRCFAILKIFGIIICTLAVSPGCSKLSSQQGLDHRKFPFSNHSAQASIESPLERASKSRQIRRDQRANRVPNNPVRELERDVQSVTRRPPKLSKMPKMTLFAEPSVTDASQVSFEQELSPASDDTPISTDSTFDPTAEPPAQIFAQPVQTTAGDQAPATRVASRRTLTPMLFNPKTREVNSDFEGSLRDDKILSKVETPAPETSDPVQTRKTVEPLLVVDEKSDPPPASTQIADVSPFSADPEMLPLQRTTADEQLVAAKASAAESNTSPPTSISTEQNMSTPVVDSAMGKRSFDLQPLTAPGVVESDIEIKSDAEHDNAGSGIKIDANLAGDFDAFPISQATQAEPQIETDEPVDEPMAVSVAPLPTLPEVQTLPELDPPTDSLLTQPIAEFEDNQVAESDFEPLPEQAKSCPTCDHDSCLGCELPETTVFAGHIPNFDPGRNIVPMPIDIASLDSAELIKKNFSNATFSPTDLPLPQDIDASSDTSKNQFLATAFENTVDNEPAIQTDVPPVGVEALMKLNAVTWQSRLAQTIDLVQEQLNQQNIDTDTRTSLEVNLRLLDVLSRQMGDLVENQQQFSSSENQYWQDQLEAITSMLKVADPVDGRANELLRHHTAHETLTHLRNAVSHLESLANLRVVAGEFCTEVSGYGQFNPFAYNVFPVGQKVLVYCEIENFNSTPQDSESGVSFLTRLRGSYAIYNSSGHAVQQAEFPTLEDTARKRRRDFYMHLPITIGNLDAGNYELHLLIEDLGGNKTASLTPPLLFTVEDQQAQPVARQARR